LLQAGDLGDHHRIRVSKGRGQLGLEAIPPGRVAAGFKNGPDFFPRIPDTQRAQGLPDRGGMVAEIINHRHAPGDAFYFHAPLDTLEGVKGGLNLLVREPAMFRRADHRQSVPHVQLTHQIQVKFEAGNFEFRRRRAEFQVKPAHGVPLAQPETLHRAMGDVQQRREIHIIPVAEQEAIARHQADEV
jgi:hypothetical protein